MLPHMHNNTSWQSHDCVHKNTCWTRTSVCRRILSVTGTYLDVAMPGNHTTAPFITIAIPNSLYPLAVKQTGVIMVRTSEPICRNM